MNFRNSLFRQKSWYNINYVYALLKFSVEPCTDQQYRGVSVLYIVKKLITLVKIKHVRVNISN